MGFEKSLFLGVILMGGVVFGSCVDHAGESEEELEQIRQDSILQADADNALIDAYIADASNGIDASLVKVGEYGVRRIVWAPAVSIRVPEYNEIVSVHYTGKYLENAIFDTSSSTTAKKSDSLNYVTDGIVFDDLLASSSKSYEELLDSLNTSDGAIDDPLFSASRLYLPIAFNHTENGTGISFNYIPGFRSGLKEAMLEMELNSKALIMIPSAVAYGASGSNPGGEGGIPANTPLVFQFDLVNIHP
ncbi:FKBP-type peptidyl-prolyl cis-trans isomerase [Reichenbachiella faecimaris]|uniref:Peptidyl-prolyl cis-trans isomerase n=1 Tax=Reichenbachiella faecimaris TaxID=692418 RepID=A0A1W2GB78_REIFA|nr:FKBP-type peptidyl-prolyl cis-trans isomerase [Reichenbachiella faecimaris]SMD33774.1 FKBP-type peptidyl-prolyl cis-trans isomerase [Reichenbachiella faecimaris]